jgi:hypothetical protein
LYITDIWKDAAFTGNRKRSNPRYERYWRSQLEIEMKGVPTERVIFVGEQARVHGWDYVPPGTPRDQIPFPSYRNKAFKTELQRLLAIIRGERLIDDSSDAFRQQQFKDAEFGQGFAATDHNWTLNKAISHNKFGVISLNQSRIQMNLSYQKSRTEKPFPVASFPLDMADLVRNGLVRKVNRGFWLRFVHDLANNSIYIQLNQCSPRRFVANLPAGALESLKNPRTCERSSGI